MLFQTRVLYTVYHAEVTLHPYLLSHFHCFMVNFIGRILQQALKDTQEMLKLDIGIGLQQSWQELYSKAQKPSYKDSTVPSNNLTRSAACEKQFEAF